MIFRIYVSVDITSCVANDSEFMAAWRQVDRHIEAAAKRVPGVRWNGSATGFDCRKANFECDAQSSVWRLMTELRETVRVWLGNREVELPIFCGFRKEPLVRIHLLRKPSRKCRALQWSLPLRPGQMVPDEPNNYLALVEISTKAAPAEMSRALRSLADSLDTPRRAAEQKS